MLQKAFWDAWDNMGRVLLVNFVFILLAAVPVFVPRALAGVPVLGMVTMLAGFLLLFVYSGGVSAYFRDLVRYESPELKDIWGHIRENWKISLLLGVLVCFFYFMCLTGFRFYSALGNVLGLVGLAFLFWVFLLVTIALVFFYPAMNNLDRDFRKIVKKSFILFFDNTGCAVVLALMILVNSVISVALALLLPGIGGILILQESAMKILLMKYDYLEENPEASRKKIPWAVLIRDEREKVGKRTLRGTIFPWKE